MLISFLGIKNVQEGLENYLNKYKYDTAQTSQLWQSFTNATVPLPDTVSNIMNTWVFQQGYPVISVKWSNDSRHIIVEQQPFISSLGPSEFAEAFNQNISIFRQLWFVPLTIITPDNVSEAKVYWLKDNSMEIELDSRYRYNNGWLKLNHNQSGFYRVNYHLDIWKQLIKMLNSVQHNLNQHYLSPSDRAGLIDDAFSLMRIGYLNVDITMNLSKYLGRKKNFI